jgi:uncharacterized protein (DUF2252 family)
MKTKRPRSDGEAEPKPEAWEAGGPGQPAVAEAPAAAPADHPAALPFAERLAAGRALRDKVPRSAHADWKPAADRPDPIDLLEESNRNRVPGLVPIRYGRMLPSPFTFLRGAAAVMAHDLAATPATGVRVQACGDCHLMNFGAFASPERTLVFDINDFDETLPAPWEWDLKRLAASVVVAGRHRGGSKRDCREAVLACVRSYRERLREFARMKVLDVWYARIAFKTLVRLSRTAAERALWEQGALSARARTAVHVIPKLVSTVREHRRIVDNPPCIYHPAQVDTFEAEMRDLFKHYRASLVDSVRFLFDRFRFVDAAVKVVGVGSVGTRCAVAYFEAGADDPLLLQVKEAQHSVLEPYAGKSPYQNQGQRVVHGQRLMQSASDIFLGWSRDDGRGFDFYVRQLRDMKGSVPLEAMTPPDLADYAAYCGWALARAHAKSGDAARISGYLGKGDAFDEAVAAFAAAYADQTERDHAALVAAVRSGRLHAEEEPEG